MELKIKMYSTSIMGITINEDYAFNNMPPRPNVYIALGTVGLYMNLGFEANVRTYTLELPYQFWLDKHSYDLGLKAVTGSNATLKANAQQVANISAFFHDSLAAGLYAANITNITIDYMSN